MVTQTSIFDKPAGQKRTFHAARWETSERLQRVLKVLSDGAWHTSFDIAMNARVVNPSGAMAELRDKINSELNIEVDENNKERYGRYRWLKKLGTPRREPLSVDPSDTPRDEAMRA